MPFIRYVSAFARTSRVERGMSTARTAIGRLFCALGLMPFYFRLVEWRLSRTAAPPPKVDESVRPPLDFPIGHFDAIYLLSVFTHLRRDTQRDSLEEFARITRPGGVVLITFHDEDHPALASIPGARTVLSGEGLFITNDALEGSNLIATFQTRESSAALFGEYRRRAHRVRKRQRPGSDARGPQEAARARTIRLLTRPRPFRVRNVA
jgi:SAM-dependent methyltransferase